MFSISVLPRWGVMLFMQWVHSHSCPPKEKKYNSVLWHNALEQFGFRALKYESVLLCGGGWGSILAVQKLYLRSYNHTAFFILCLRVLERKWCPLKLSPTQRRKSTTPSASLTWMVTSHFDIMCGNTTKSWALSFCAVSTPELCKGGMCRVLAQINKK